VGERDYKERDNEPKQPSAMVIVEIGNTSQNNKIK
jgi:hypothetical protein